jgi:MFS family permease
MSDEGDPIDRIAARRNGRRLLLVIGGLGLVSGAVGGVLGGLRNHGGSTGHAQHSSWFLLLLLALVIVVPLVAAGAALVWLMRRPSYQRVMQYGWSERRRTFKTIKAGRPLDQRQVRIARATLDYTERQRWILWLFPVLIVLWLLSGLTHSDDLFGKLDIGLAALYLLGLPFMLWQRRRVIDRTRHALDRARPS